MLDLQIGVLILEALVLSLEGRIVSGSLVVGIVGLPNQDQESHDNDEAIEYEYCSEDGIYNHAK